MSHAPAESSFRFTYGDYVQWTGDDRWELIDGIPYDMTPAPNLMHQLLLGELYAQIRLHFRGKQTKVLLAPTDVRLPNKSEADEKIRTVVQPDIAVVCDLDKLDSRGCRGIPDWVIEILSPSTASKDRTVKVALYQSHGVREYWLVDVDLRQITVYLLQENGMFNVGRTIPCAGQQPVGIFPGLVIDWDDIFANL